MIFLGRLASLAVASLGAATLMAWWLQLDWLLVVLPSTMPIQPDAALCFLLAGVAISIPPGKNHPLRAGRTLAAAIVLVVASASLLQLLIGLDSPAGSLLSSNWQPHNGSYPGGMAPQVAGALFGIGCTALLLGIRLSPLRDAIIHGLAIAVFMIGMSGIIGHVANLPILYQLPQHSSIAPLGAACLVLLAVSNTIAWRHVRANDGHRPIPSDNNRRFILFNLLAGSVLAIIMTGAVVLTRTVDQLQTATLENILRMQSRSVREELKAADVATDSIAGRPYLILQLKLVNEGMATEDTLMAIRRAINSIVINNVNAMAIYALNGKLVAQRGDPERIADFDIALDHTHRLLWSDVPILRRTIQMMLDGQLVATAVVDVKLPNINAILEDAHAIGPSAESGICGAFDLNKVLCMPQRHRPAVSKVDRVREGKTLPIGHALDGRRGTMLAVDYRRQSVAASYAPIEGYPLGMVTKVDRTDLSSPVQNNFHHLIVALSVLLISAVLAHHLGPSRVMAAGGSAAAA